jgi:hypothetical protein
VEAAVNYVAATSPFAPLLARCEALLLVASCDDMQQPPVPQSHVTPLVDYQLPVSVQEFFLCFISDDHQFNTKVTPSHSIPLFPRHLTACVQYHAALDNHSICSTPWQAVDGDPHGRLSSSFEWKQKSKSGLGGCAAPHCCPPLPSRAANSDMFSYSLYSMFGPKEIHCLQHCRASLSSDMSRCTIREEVFTPTVPYGGTFSCISYTDVRAATGNPNACLVSITAYVAFNDRPNYLISGKIVSEAHKDYSSCAALWKDMAVRHCMECAAMLSDFRAMTNARTPSAQHAAGGDATSLLELSSRLQRALSRTASTDSFGSESRRNSEISRVGQERGRASRHGSFAAPPNDQIAPNALAMRVEVGDGNLLVAQQTEFQSHTMHATAAAARAGGAFSSSGGLPAPSISMSNSK